MTQENRYSRIARALHWLIAGLIVSQYVIAELAEQAEHAGRDVQQLGLLANHKSIGMTVVMLAVVRLLWRLFNKPPVLSNDVMPAWQHRASSIAHWLMYGLIFAIPLSGWMMSSASAYSVSWFNVFAFPDLIEPSKNLADTLHEVHEILAKSLFVIVVVHIAAALKHHFIDKDDVLKRMASVFGWVLMLGTIALVIGLFGSIKTASNSGDSQAVVIPQTVDGEPATRVLSDLPLWNINYPESYITFSGDQAGAPFEGRWQRWTAQMQFDRERLGDGGFDVEIETASAFSDDQTRDEYIVGSDFFDAQNHAIARFTADQFTVTSNSEYRSQGNLTVKGLTKSLAFTFSVEENGDGFVLNGSATIDRLAWNIGTGDWVDPTWVGKDVTVKVKVVATADTPEVQ